MELMHRELAAAFMPPPNYTSEQVMMLAMVERAYYDLKCSGYYRRTAIGWFLNYNACSLPLCIPFKRICAELEFSQDRIKYLLNAAIKADEGINV